MNDIVAFEYADDDIWQKDERPTHYLIPQQRLTRFEKHIVRHEIYNQLEWGDGGESCSFFIVES